MRFCPCIEGDGCKIPTWASVMVEVPLSGDHADLWCAVSHAGTCLRCEVWEKWDVSCCGSGSAGKPWCRYSLARASAVQTTVSGRLCWKWEHLLCWSVRQLRHVSQERSPSTWSPITSSSLLALTSLSVNCPCLEWGTAEIKKEEAQNQWHWEADMIQSPWFWQAC